MRQFARIALASSLLLSTVACAQPAATPVAQTPVAAVAPTTAKADASRLIVANAIAKAAKPMVKDLGNANGAAVAVSVKAPKADRKVQALQHRWVSTDVMNYEVTLLTTDGNGDYTATVAAINITSAAYNTSTNSAPALAAFTGLEANKLYKVTVKAWGSNPSTAETTALQVLNTQTAAEAFFDFTEDGNATIENSPPAQDVTIVLDSYEFSGTANVNATIVDGTFKPAAGGVQANAVVPVTPPSAGNNVQWGAWGWDIVQLIAYNVNLTPVLANDGNTYVPNAVRWVAFDGDGHAFPGGGYWFDGSTSVTENWYYGGQFTPHNTHSYGFKAVYDNGAGVYGESAIQATTYINF